MGLKLNAAQVVGILLLLALVGLLSIELLNALGAQACSAAVYDGCYPGARMARPQASGAMRARPTI